MPPPENRSPIRRLGTRITRIARSMPLKAPRILVLLAGLSLLLALPVAAQVIGHSTAPRTTAQSNGNAAANIIGRADLHLDGEAIEINLSITQAENSCQAPLNGQFCLRYSMATDDVPFQAGYGLIPNGDVTITGSSIRVDVDTSTSRFHHVVGVGGPIAVTWTSQPGSTVVAGGQTSSLSPASVTGSVIAHTLPGTGVTASVLLYISG